MTMHLSRAYEAKFKYFFSLKSPQQLQHSVSIGETVLQRDVLSRNAATSIRSRGQDFLFYEASSSRTRAQMDVNRLDEAKARICVAAVSSKTSEYRVGWLESMKCRNAATYQLNKLAEKGCHAV